MLRSLLLHLTPSLLENQQDEVFFPDNHKHVPHFQHTNPNRQTFASTKQSLRSTNFITIDQGQNELNCKFQLLEPYEQDKIKFMTKVVVEQEKAEISRNRIRLLPEPIHANPEAITFLLQLEWFPNSSKQDRRFRKGSFVSEKQVAVMMKQKQPIEGDDLLHLAFLLSQKLYIPEKHIDECLTVVAAKTETNSRHLNCLTIIAQTLSKDNFPSTQLPSDGETQYPIYQYEGSLEGEESEKSPRGFPRLSRVSSSRFYKKGTAHTPRMSKRKSSPRIHFEDDLRKTTGMMQQVSGRVKRQDFNLVRAKHYFSAIEYLRVEEQLQRETVVLHLKDNKNAIRGGMTYEAISQTVLHWPKHNSYDKILSLNKKVVMGKFREECLDNYKAVMRLQLQQVSAMSIEQIYQILNQLHTKAINEFIEGSIEFHSDPDHTQQLLKLGSELNKCEEELVSNFAHGKKEEGRRIMANLQHKHSKKSLDSYTMMKVVGKEQISKLQIGYRMYKQILESKVADGFEEIAMNRSHLRGGVPHRSTGNNEEDMLNQIENRIEICEEKKRMLSAAIELSLRQRQTLNMFVRDIESNRSIESVISEEGSNNN